MSKITNDGLTRSGWHMMLYSCSRMATVDVKRAKEKHRWDRHSAHKKESNLLELCLSRSQSQREAAVVPMNATMRTAMAVTRTNEMRCGAASTSIHWPSGVRRRWAVQLRHWVWAGPEHSRQVMWQRRHTARSCGLTGDVVLVAKKCFGHSV